MRRLWRTTFFSCYLYTVSTSINRLIKIFCDYYTILITYILHYIKYIFKYLKLWGLCLMDLCILITWCRIWSKMLKLSIQLRLIIILIFPDGVGSVSTADWSDQEILSWGDVLLLVTNQWAYSFGFSCIFSPLMWNNFFWGYSLIRRKIFGMQWQQSALYNKVNNC